MSLSNRAHPSLSRHGPQLGLVAGKSCSRAFPQAELFLDAITEDLGAAQSLTTQHSAAQALKALLMDTVLDDQPAQRLLQITAKVPEACLQAWHLVAHTLLARRLDAAGPPSAHSGSHRNNAHTVAWALQRQWEQPLLAQRWERLLKQLSPAQCERLVKQVRRQIRAH
jgi:hypothetical protein